MVEAVERVEETASSFLTNRTDILTKVKVKCWIYHSKAMVSEKKQPMDYSKFNRILSKQMCLDYIDLDLIDCEDIGGKKRAIRFVNDWFTI